jgi:hypothetical protein
VTKFIEERIKLVRSMAEKADPFIKPRLLALADRYETQLSLKLPARAVRDYGLNLPLPVWISSSER